jgi:hypothetical protein
MSTDLAPLALTAIAAVMLYLSEFRYRFPYVCGRSEALNRHDWMHVTQRP